MVQSRPHHLRHQWSQISTFVSLNHIRHHTYSKSSYVHIQVFHILHHHTMKLLLVIKSFLPRRPFVEIGSENWFAAGSPFGSENWFAAGSSFGSENCFAADAIISTAKTGSLQPTCFAAANATLLQTTQFRQRVTNSLQTIQLRQRMLIRCRQLSFGSESQIRCRTPNSATNVNSLQTTQFRQRLTDLLQTTSAANHKFTVEYAIRQ